MGVGYALGCGVWASRCERKVAEDCVRVGVGMWAWVLGVGVDVYAWTCGRVTECVTQRWKIIVSKKKKRKIR